MPRRRPMTPERIAQLRACPVMAISDATQIYGIGRNKVYMLMHAGRLPFKKIGNSTLLSVAGLEALIAMDEAEASA